MFIEFISSLLTGIIHFLGFSKLGFGELKFVWAKIKIDSR